MSKLEEYRTFVRRAAREPSTVGAVWPTSQYAAAAMANVVPVSGPATVVELGPGTGALSDAIHRRLRAGRPADEPRRHVAVEIDTELVRYLRSAKPWLRVLEGDAEHLRSLLEAEGISAVDAVLSSLPWTLLPQRKQAHLLEAVGSVLEPDGVFTSITYLTTLWRANTAAFLRNLHAHFDEVIPRSMVWRNVPPARLYVCRRPR